MRTKYINIKYISLWLMGSIMLGVSPMLGGCSNYNEVLEQEPTETIVAPKGITFKLNGAAGAGISRAATMAAIDTEKTINTVYVALFTPDNKLRLIYSTESEAVTTVGVENPNITDNDDGSYTFKPLYAGDYTAFFIANPGTGLTSKFGAMTPLTTTLDEFEKTVVEDTANGLDADGAANPGFLMSSGKMTLNVFSDATNDIGNITMTRLAARFDIINSHPYNASANTNGATITKVQILNEATKANISTQETMPNGSTQNGTEIEWSKATEEKLTLYTYENINTGTSDDGATAIRVSYKLGASGEVKTLNVTLKEEGTNLAVKRNNLYQINLNCVTGTYALTVEDWDEAKATILPGEKLAITYEATDLGKIGDYVYKNGDALDFSDGGLRGMSYTGLFTWTERPAPDPNKGTCVGIVFSNLTSAIDQAAGYTGYAIALKNAATKLTWRTKDEKAAGIPVVKTLQAVIRDLDGYTHCNAVTKNEFPAMAAAMDYSVDLPAGTSGWYLPSIGQIAAVAQSFMEINNMYSMTGTASNGRFSITCTNTVSDMNTFLFGKLDASQYDAFPTNGQDWLSTISQGDNRAYRGYWRHFHRRNRCRKSQLQESSPLRLR